MDRDALLQLSRRVDWRFLLSNPELGRVSHVGRPDPELVRASEEFAGDGDQEVLVARNVPAGLLDHAAGRLGGGWVYAEFEGPFAVRRARRAASTLEASGFASVRLHWHRPSFGACEELVPLDDRDALRLALARQQRAAPAKARVGRLLLSTRLLPFALPAVSVIAGPTEVDERRILVTPRFRASRHVVSLALGDDGEPVTVVKTPRLRADDAGVEREHAALEALAAAGVEAVPRAISFDEGLGRRVLAMTAVRGRPLTRADVRGDRGACLEPVRKWALSLARLGDGPVDDAAYGRLVERPLRRVASELPALAQLVEETLGAVAPLRHAKIAHAFEHGDLSEPNLIWLPGAAVGLVDWELAEPHGLPLHDLCFFLAYVAFAEAGTPSRAAFNDAYFGRTAWASREVAEHAQTLGISRDLLTPLFLACWSRYAAGLLERLADGPVSPELAAWLRPNRFFVLWEHAVSHAAELDWPQTPINV